MIERDFGGDLRSLTPQELNQGLGIFFRFLPIVTAEKFSSALANVDFTPEGIASTNWGRMCDDLIQEFFEGVNRRSRSEFLSSAKERLTALLQLSHLTSSAIQCVVETYSREFSLGFATPRGAISGDLYWLLDFENPSSGGIFDPKTAHGLEQKLFLQKLDRYESLQFIQDCRTSSGNMPNGKPYYDQETIKKGEENMKDLRQSIEEWKIEYRDKYGEPPPSIKRNIILL